MLVENRRINGKVKQEIIAMFGSIDAAWLPEFWDGLDKKTAAKLQTENWELYSLRARTAFWKVVNRRLKQLENRLGPDKKRIRRAVDARVPWLMPPERKRLELLEAKHDYDLIRGSIDYTRRSIASDEKIIKSIQKRIDEFEQLAQKQTLVGAHDATTVARLSAELMALRTRGR